LRFSGISETSARLEKWWERIYDTSLTSAPETRNAFPEVIHIPAEQGHIAPGFTEIVRLIAREATTPRQGTQVMLRRLTELLFIQVIRIWVEQQAGAETGWLAAL